MNRGDKVRLSVEGKNVLVHPFRGRLTKDSEGTVVGFGRDGYTIRVKVDCYSTIKSYHVDFWEPI